MTSTTHMPHGRLRILETTDLHMHLLAYDYFSDQADDRLGLVGLADVIDGLRAENDCGTLLFDNGDFLQGNPMADTLAATLGPDEVHPMIAAMNCLQYDAITLGNHEFDYGLDFLRQTLRQSTAAILSANIRCTTGAPLASEFRILTRDMQCSDGVWRTIRIGVTGFAPPQITDRDSDKHLGQIKVDDIVLAARRIVPQMQAEGADVIIALCHSGIGAPQTSPLMENAAVPLAAVDGLDVLLVGHTHEKFPDPDGAISDCVDPAAGTLHDKPAVMAGYYGTSLGVIDLGLAWDGHGWRIQRHTARLQKPRPAQRRKSARRQEIEELAATAHATTLRHMRKPVAHTTVPIHNYFATIQPDLGMQLLAQAMRDAVPADIAASCVLAAVSPFQSGGRNGLGHFLDVPAGQLTLRDAAAIFPFADTLCAVRRTGAQLKDWLERATSHYNRITPNTPRQILLNPCSAAYNCDALHGLTYEIDLTQPARFDVSGKRIAQKACRISHVTLDGRAVRDDDIFVVATNSFRARGGGGFTKVPQSDVVWQTSQKLRDILIASLRNRAQISDAVQPIWRFRPIAGAQAQFQTAAQAKQHLAHPITHLGAGEDGFETYSLAF